MKFQNVDVSIKIYIFVYCDTLNIYTNFYYFAADSIGQLSDVQYEEFERARLQLQEDNDYDVRQCAGVVPDKTTNESKYSDVVVPWPEIDNEVENKTDAEFPFYRFYPKTGTYLSIKQNDIIFMM